MSISTTGGPRILLATAARGTALALAALFAYVVLGGFDGLALTFFRLQDCYVILVFGASLLMLTNLPDTRSARITLEPKLMQVVLIAIIGALSLWAGTYLIMRNYALTRDEHMVVFDMGIFTSGRLAAAVSPHWRHYALALVPAFLLDIPQNAAFVSAYMPGNAALRTAFSLVADPALMNPLLAGVGFFALFDVARRVFPNDGDTQAVVLLLYATSAQILVTAMTSYAMTAHLCLNLVWLALFLRNTRITHAAALTIGVVATGLHQVIFHPLFVLPFMFYLAQCGRWRTMWFYILGYAVAGLFWLSYPHIVVSVSGIAMVGPSGTSAGPLGFLRGRVLPLLLDRDDAALTLMSANLLRFAAWQNLALIPLVLIALPVARRAGELAQPLYLGILFTLFAMFVLLPYQGHGWGYRYLHGLIGSMALLAGFGWRRLIQEGQPARQFVRMATAITVLFALPFLLWSTYRFVAPYADVDLAISRLDADVAVIDTEDVAFAIDEVRNPADLSARPIRLSSRVLSPADLWYFCGSRSVVFVSRPAMQAIGLGREHTSRSPHFEALRTAYSAGCQIKRKQLLTTGDYPLG